MNCLVQEKKKRVISLVTCGIGWAGVLSDFSLWGLNASTCPFLPSPIGNSIFKKIVVSPQGRSGRPLPSHWAMTIDHEIQQILKNQIPQQPCSYVLITLDEDVIYIGQLEGRMHTHLLSAITCRAKYVANCVVWHSSRECSQRARP